MFALDQAWDIYFHELDPKERLVYLDRLADVEDTAEQAVAAFCRTLYRERYTHPKDPNRPADNWLWKLVYLPGLYKRRGFLRGAMRRELEGTLKELHLDSPETLSEMEKTVLYLEFRNAARRYLSTCKGSRYGSKFLGLKQATEQEQLDQACEEIWSISKGLAYAAGLEEKLQLWCGALYAELLEFDPNAGRLYAELDAKSKK